MSDPPIRVAIGEDAAPVRAALRSLIESEPGMEFVGSGADAVEVAALCATAEVHVAVLDVHMPNGGGVAAAQEILRVSPRTKIVVYSAHSDSATESLMRAAGAVGFVSKGGPIDDLLTAVAAAASTDIGA